MLRIIFLDFDGVLHPSSAQPADYFCRSDLLAEVLTGVDCGIVISSSWRHHQRLGDIITQLPRSIRALVRGATGGPHIGRWPRYNEIQSYLRSNAAGVAWRALDDSWIEFPAKCPELIRCDPNVGFDLGQADQLRRWLEGL